MDGEDAVWPQIQTEGRGRVQSRGVKVMPIEGMLKQCTQDDDGMMNECLWGLCTRDTPFYRLSRG